MLLKIHYAEFDPIFIIVLFICQHKYKTDTDKCFSHMDIFLGFFQPADWQSTAACYSLFHTKNSSQVF